MAEMRFRNLFDLREYLDRLIDLGLGNCRPMLDRRGCACSHEPAPLGDPGEGERVSADGQSVYLSVRLMEDQS